MPKTTDWIQTFTGRKFYPLEPDAMMIDITDIAHSLSLQCRFTGHCKKFYSVAQHSVLMARYFLSNGTPQAALWALLHDASEAYLSDIPRPLKQLPQFDFYRQAERHLQEMILLRFGLFPTENYLIPSLDHRMLNAEAAALMAPLHPDWPLPPHVDPIPIESWLPETAEDEFLTDFFRLKARLQEVVNA